MKHDAAIQCLSEVVERTATASGLSVEQVIDAVNLAFGRDVARALPKYAPVFTDAELQRLRALHQGREMATRDVYYALRMCQPTHGEAIQAGRQLQQTFKYRKIGPITMYAIAA